MATDIITNLYTFAAANPWIGAAAALFSPLAFAAFHYRNR